MSVHNTTANVSSGATGLAAGIATALQYGPVILGCLVSVASLVWLGLQAYWAIKDRKAKGLPLL